MNSVREFNDLTEKKLIHMLKCIYYFSADAITPLMSAMKITAQNKLDFFHALVTLHTAHLQLQLGLSSRALKTVQSCLPMILVSVYIIVI